MRPGHYFALYDRRGANARFLCSHFESATDDVFRLFREITGHDLDLSQPIRTAGEDGGEGLQFVEEEAHD